MGQTTFALMYGIERPSDVDFFGEGGDSGLWGEWRTACADRINAYEAKHPHRSYEDPWGDDVYVPARPYESTLDLVGFYVAVGASGEAGVPDLKGCALGNVRAAYPEAYKAARRRWRRFAKWAAAKGIALPKARMYLTETEVA